MNYRLRMNIHYDKSRWTWQEFYKERNKFYESILKRFESHKGRIDDLWVELQNGNSKLAEVLIRMAKSKGYDFDIGAFVDYTQKEITDAKYVRLMALGNCVDHDKEYKFLNKYTKIECFHCGRPDYEHIPDPYFVYEIVLKKRKDIYYAENGIMVLSQRAFDLIRDDIEPWIDFRRPNVVDDERNIISSNPEYLWIRPKYSIGRFVNEEIMQRCCECGEPIQIAKNMDGDIFERAKEIVESFCNIEAPIVRAGSWFGHFPPGSAHSRGYEVFVSGWLHEKVRKLRLKGFVKADYVIHAADEPYDWDPLGNKSCLPNGQLDCIRG